MTKKILLGLSLGIVLGLFFGEYVAFLSILGDAFIGLLQMTVLPYIMISLMVNLGQLNLAKSKKLISAASMILVFSLIFGMALVVTLPSFFPEWESASLFSTSLIAEQKTFDPIALYIPSNPFKSLAENVVPAVVLFSILMGISLMSVEGKSGLIKGMKAFADALNKANKIIIKLTPVGIFGIAASTTGTITLSEIGRLQVYLISYSAISLVLSMITIPLLISAITPFKYKDVLRVPGSTLLTIFASGKIIILLPQLIENVNTLYDKEDLRDQDIEASSELLFPLAYPFPNMGTLLILIFVPFAAWFVGKPLDFEEVNILLGAGVLSSFIAPITGIPFLLDILHIPIDTFQMFVVSTVYTDRIRVVLGAVFLYGLTILSIAHLKGLLKIHPLKLLGCLAVTTVLILSVFLPLKYFGGDSFQNSFDKYELFIEMDLRESYERVVERDYQPPSDSINNTYRSLSQIKSSGVIRVGYYSDALPFAFRNSKNNLVGLDIEMAYALAHELNLRLELIHIPRNTKSIALNSGIVDIIMSGTPIEIELLEQLNFTIPYMSQTFALMVKDHLRNQYESIEDIRAQESIHIAIVESDVLAGEIREAIPNMITHVVASPKEFFRQKDDRYDALLFTAESGSAWTLIYPEYAVVIPSKYLLKLPMAYPIAKENLSLLEFMNGWITIKKEENFINRYFEHWILGKGSEKTEPHWSVIRNVLHWVD